MNRVGYQAIILLQHPLGGAPLLAPGHQSNSSSLIPKLQGSYIICGVFFMDLISFKTTSQKFHFNGYMLSCFALLKKTS